MFDEQVDGVIQSLQPDMTDYADNERFFYWMDYAEELDDISLVVYDHGREDLIGYLNHSMKTKLSLSPQHHAAVDVATTLENLIPEFKGVFVYE